MLWNPDVEKIGEALGAEDLLRLGDLLEATMDSAELAAFSRGIARGAAAQRAGRYARAARPGPEPLTINLEGPC